MAIELDDAIPLVRSKRILLLGMSVEVMGLGMEDSVLAGAIKLWITECIIKSWAGYPRPTGDTVSPDVHGWIHRAVGVRMLSAPLTMDCRVLMLLLHGFTGYLKR